MSHTKIIYTQSLYNLMNIYMLELTLRRNVKPQFYTFSTEYIHAFIHYPNQNIHNRN